ncbi:hypothetical protein ACYOEI_24660, partial [Singulisphaera rosea]
MGPRLPSCGVVGLHFHDRGGQGREGTIRPRAEGRGGAVDERVGWGFELMGPRILALGELLWDLLPGGGQPGGGPA